MPQPLLDLLPLLRSHFNCGGTALKRRSRQRDRYYRPWWRGFYFGAISFLLALLIVFPSRIISEQFHWTAAAVAILVIVSIGVIFDVIGVAAAASEESPFNAMAARRVIGARHALRLVRHADRVSAICADVVGDIVGTISGAAGAALILRLAIMMPDLTPYRNVMHVTVIALIAGLTVGGKAACKSFALTRWTDILFLTGKVMWWLETYLHLSLLNDTNQKRGRNYE